MLALKHGVLISVEGIDGSGKSTLIQSLGSHFAHIQLPTVTTKEPGGTPLGKHLRALVQERTVPLCSQAEFLLFAADRAQHFNEVIIPALTNKNLVISDRMADSSLVYQGYGRGLDKSFITSVNTWAMQGRVPDLTLYIRITPQVAYDRLVARKKALTAIEQEKQEFFERLVHGFDTLYEHRKDVITIDGHNEPHKVFTDAIKSLTPFLQPYLQNS